MIKRHTCIQRFSLSIQNVTTLCRSHYNNLGITTQITKSIISTLRIMTLDYATPHQYFGTNKGTLGNMVSIGEPCKNIVSIFLQCRYSFILYIYMLCVQNDISHWNRSFSWESLNSMPLVAKMSWYYQDHDIRVVPHFLARRPNVSYQ